MTRNFRSIILSIAVGAFVPVVPAAAQTPRPDPADLVLRNGRVMTVDPSGPQAQAVAVRGSRIIAVGTNAQMTRLIGPKTKVLDLTGKLVVPGLIEGHGHFMGLGDAKMNLDLTKVKNWNEIVGLVRSATRDVKKDAWIVGRGWHQEKWNVVPQPNVEGVPLHASLDVVSADNPVILEHASGHATFANKRALELAGITRRTPNPAGGEIVKDRNGEPTGLLRETAAGLVDRAFAVAESRRTPAERAATNKRMSDLAFKEALSKGITTFVDAGSNLATIDYFKGLEAQHAMPLRIYMMARTSNADLEKNLDRYRMPADTNDYFVVRSIKVQIDGALGSHGAWLLKPYADLPSSVGLATTTPKSVEQTAKLAIAHGFQLNVHAIGDRANREVLDIYERTFNANKGKTDLRWRIEHAQHLDPADIPRFAKLGVLASMQSIHATSDGPWVEKKLGAERTKNGAYVWRSLIDSGARINNGTDVPVEDIDPIANFYAAVSRMTNTGKRFTPEQRMTRQEALASYTINNAYAAFWENELGSITVGKLADITVLDRDIMTIPEAQIPSAKVLYTIVGGKIRYQSPAATPKPAVKKKK
jgi:predicted amidohydrolase YtcJ